MGIFNRRKPANLVLTAANTTEAAETTEVKPLEFVPGYACPACGAETMHEWAGYAHRCDTCKQEVMKDVRQPDPEDK